MACRKGYNFAYLGISNACQRSAIPAPLEEMVDFFVNSLSEALGESAGIASQRFILAAEKPSL